jgi:eukaryotic-like serine/threonine-protein kinase
MPNSKRACDPSQLKVLLFGQEESDEYRSAASHVESCQMCRSRLTDLAGDAQTWKEVRFQLSDYPDLPDLDTQAFSKSDPQLRLAEESAGGLRVSEMIGPPSHPEMLGRLGRYEIASVIGSGGMGVVFKGFDTELNRPVAIKVLASHLAHSGAARQRFAREARAAAAIVHEHVVAIHNVETDGEFPFLVMQYVRGESLQARIDRGGPLTAKEILRIGIQMAAGLAAAHAQGVVHRDIKPANILLEEGVERVLLTDFGLARTVDDASLTHTGIVAGTPHYMSPEQASGDETDYRTDLFSLGSVLYFMATGRPPFRAERAMGVLHRICRDRHRPVWQVNPDIPDALGEAIDRLLEKKPSRRFASAEDVQLALSKLLAHLQQGRMLRSRRVRRFVRRRKGLIAAVVSVGVLALVAVSVPWQLGGPTDQDRQDPPVTVEVLQQASSAEPSQYASAADELQRLVRDFEIRTQAATYAHSDFGWSRRVQSILERLELLRGDTFTGPQSHSVTGETP